MKLRCYCCGTLILDAADVALVSLNGGDADRAFIFLPEHADRAEGATVEIVKRDPRHLTAPSKSG